jgi:hypothetical protein
MAPITIVNGVYKPSFHHWGAPSCIDSADPDVESSYHVVPFPGIILAEQVLAGSKSYTKVLALPIYRLPGLVK